MNGEHTPIEKAGADLRAAVSMMPEMASRFAGGWHPAMAAAAAAVAVGLLIGVPALLTRTGPGGGGPAGDGRSPITTATTLIESTTSQSLEETTTGPVAAVCGTELPFTIVLPDDFQGPFSGPSPHSSDPAEDGQVLWHWTGRGGSVELRRPANAGYTDGAVWGSQSTRRDSDGTAFVFLQDVTIDGVEYRDLPQAADQLPTDAMSGQCDATQLSVFGPGGAERANSMFGLEDPEQPNTLILYPDLPRPRDQVLIVESMSVETVPLVLECAGGSEAAGFEVPPIENETTTDLVAFPTPVEALEALLAGKDTWPKTGYFELHEPDGSITYGNPLDDLSPDPRPENGLVISISVVEGDDGWAVDSWSSSGC